MPYRGAMPCPKCRPNNRTHVNRHEHTHLTVAGPLGTIERCVDTGMVPLLTALWRAAIPTFMSCQGGPEPTQRAWVTILTGSGFEASICLLDDTFRAAGDERLRRMLMRQIDTEEFTDAQEAELWRWDVRPSLAMNAGTQRDPFSGQPVAFFALSFPPADLPDVSSALAAAGR